MSNGGARIHLQKVGSEIKEAACGLTRWSAIEAVLAPGSPLPEGFESFACRECINTLLVRDPMSRADLRDYSLIPATTMDSMQRYIDRGIPTGDFLCAVISNNLMQAVSHADFDNQPAILPLAKWLYNRAPIASHGSLENYRAWIAHQGLTGYKERTDDNS